MKVRQKITGYVVSISKNSDGTFTDDHSGRVYASDELDFECPHTKYSDIGDIICGDYTKDHAFGFSNVKYPTRNIRVKFSEQQTLNEKECAEVIEYFKGVDRRPKCFTVKTDLSDNNETGITEIEEFS